MGPILILTLSNLDLNSGPLEYFFNKHQLYPLNYLTTLDLSKSQVGLTTKKLQT